MGTQYPGSLHSGDVAFSYHNKDSMQAAYIIANLTNNVKAEQSLRASLQEGHSFDLSHRLTQTLGRRNWRQHRPIFRVLGLPFDHSCHVPSAAQIDYITSSQLRYARSSTLGSSCTQTSGSCSTLSMLFSLSYSVDAGA